MTNLTDTFVTVNMGILGSIVKRVTHWVLYFSCITLTFNIVESVCRIRSMGYWNSPIIERRHFEKTPDFGQNFKKFDHWWIIQKVEIFECKNVTDTILWQGHHDRGMQLNWLYLVAYARWCHWRCGQTQLWAATINQFACPSYSLYVQLLWYPIYYPGGMKVRVSPVQWSKPNSRLAFTQDSNPGGRIQNHERWPLHYHYTLIGSGISKCLRWAQRFENFWTYHFKLIRITCQAVCHGKAVMAKNMTYLSNKKKRAKLMLSSFPDTPCPRHIIIPFGAETPLGHLAQAFFPRPDLPTMAPTTENNRYARDKQSVLHPNLATFSRDIVLRMTTNYAIIRNKYLNYESLITH